MKIKNIFVFLSIANKDEKKITDEGDQLFKMGIKILQQSKSQKQKAE